MTAQSEPGPAPVRTPPLPSGSGSRKGRPEKPGSRDGGRVWLVLGGLLLLHVLHPLTWGVARPSLWFPPAGLGLALVAWFGPRGALLVLVDGLLVGLQAYLLGQLPPSPSGAAGLG